LLSPHRIGVGKREERNTLPLYEYKCVKCGHRFEKIESLSASTTKKCPKCGARAARMLAAPAIQFKGSGWYVTDYAGKNPGKTGESADGGAKTSEKSGDSKESKPPETKNPSDKDPSKKKK
jgi:putative FmdB family regulatory protein